MLTFAYPLWFLLLCALAGLGVTLLLYLGDRTFRESPRAVVWGMGVLRFLGYSLVAALLLSPQLRLVRTEREEPIVVMLQDVSESIGMETDTLAYAERWRALRDDLAEEYRVADYTFGSETRRAGELRFTDKETDLDAALTEVADLYGNQNLGAVILATDGIYNRGTDPVYRELTLGAPVYTIGLGDTTRRRDLLVSRVFHNRIAYLGDQFAIQVDVSARNATDERTTLTVSRIGEGGVTRLHTESVSIDSDDFFTTREVLIEADRPGVQRYRIALSGVGEEITTDNNRREIFVDVLDARQRVLLLAAAPHPDLGALRQTLEGGRNKEVEVAYAGGFTGSVEEFDLVVLHQLPSATARVNGVLEAAREASVPLFFITGSGLPPPIFNATQSLVNQEGGGARVRGNEVNAVYNTGFQSFTLSEPVRQALANFPPLTAPFGTFTIASPDAEVVLRQRIGRVDTEYPLLVVGEDRGGGRVGVLLGSGLWRWRLYDYLENGSHERFDEFAGQLVQYLTVQEDRRRFRATAAQNIFDENEAVRLDAELYNASYELVNDPEATLTVYGPEGREYDYTFTRGGNAYTLDAGTLPTGSYGFRAVTNFGGEELTSEGRFVVQPVALESYALEADHGLLRRLSDNYGGRLLPPDSLAVLPGLISGGDSARPLLYERVSSRSALSLEWLFFVLLALFGAEWGLRRYQGGY